VPAPASRLSSQCRDRDRGRGHDRDRHTRRLGVDERDRFSCSAGAEGELRLASSIARAACLDPGAMPECWLSRDPPMFSLASHGSQSGRPEPIDSLRVRSSERSPDGSRGWSFERPPRIANRAWGVRSADGTGGISLVLRTATDADAPDAQLMHCRSSVIPLILDRRGRQPPTGNSNRITARPHIPSPVPRSDL
jgi:hypothetical protein